MTRGGLYHYTASKRDLLLAVTDELMQPLLSQARELIERPQPAEVHLRQLMRLWLAHIATHRNHMIVFSQERDVSRGPGWSEVREARRRFERMLAEVMDRGVEEGSFRMADPQRQC